MQMKSLVGRLVEKLLCIVKKLGAIAPMTTFRDCENSQWSGKAPKGKEGNAYKVAVDKLNAIVACRHAHLNHQSHEVSPDAPS